MTEAEIKSEMRLWALELVVANSFASICMMDAKPDAVLKQVHDQMIRGAKKRTFSGVHPAMSDLFSSALETALDRLIGMAGVQMQIGRGSAGRS
jgi:hypothetical protein